MRKTHKGEMIRKPQRLTNGRTTITLIGFYELHEEDWHHLVEILITGPRYVLYPLADLEFYTQPYWDEPPIPVRPHFILDPSGETLIGSYLHPWKKEEETTMENVRQRVTFRFVSHYPEMAMGHLMTPLGTLMLNECEPIPERLLRLIWLDL
jgi:hypothetical protein